MNTLKEALGDYVHENFNRSKQGNFLKTENLANIGLPLKEEQIKVNKRDQVLIKQGNKYKTKSDRAAAKYDPYMGMKPKKEEFKQYDLKTDKIVEVIKKKKKNYGSSSESDD